MARRLFEETGFEQQTSKRGRMENLIPYQFNIIKEHGFEKIYDFLMGFENIVIAGGYPSAMFYGTELFENSDVDVFCINLEVETFVICMKNFFPLEYRVLHEKLVDVVFKGFHRKVSFISIKDENDGNYVLAILPQHHPQRNYSGQNDPGQNDPEKNYPEKIMDDFDSSYCRAAIHKGIPYILSEIIIARNTHEVFFHIYPRKKRVEKMLQKGFTFAGYNYKETYEEFFIDETTPNFLLINHINTMAATDFTLAKFENPNEIKNLFVYDRSKTGTTGNYFVSDGIPFYSVNYDGRQPLKYTTQRNNILCPYFELDTYYGNMRNRVYVSFVLELQGKMEYYGDIILDEESDAKHIEYVNNFLSKMNIGGRYISNGVYVNQNKISFGIEDNKLLLLTGIHNLYNFTNNGLYLNRNIKFTVQFFIYRKNEYDYTVVNKLICISTNY